MTESGAAVGQGLSRRVPTATYRLQLRPGFGFDEAAALAPYLARLGASHLYSSPYLQAAPGSTHGYDIVDPRRVNSELGGPLGHRRLARRLGRLGLGQVLDVVPNHMAISGPENPWWLDVLENGQASRYARYFDVDWQPPEAYLRDRILLPILGDRYGRVLRSGEIVLERSRGTFTIRYHGHRLPVAPRSLGTVVAAAGERARSDDLRFVGDALQELPPPNSIDRASVDRRHRDAAVLRRQLLRLIREQPRLRDALDAAVADVNGDVDALHDLLERQNYRLAFWQAASRDVGYRRFFDVSTLVGLRVEDVAVFADSHARVLDWLRDGLLDGVRIDHPDGLRDPAGYLRRLRAAAPGAWIVVEKILEGDEELRDDWPVDGTTGYDALNLIAGVFVETDNAQAMTRIYEDFTGLTDDLETVSREARKAVLSNGLGADLNRLTALLVSVCERHRDQRDYTRHECHEALRELASAFPIYRTYIEPKTGRVAEADRRAIEVAVSTATASRPDLDAGLFGFLADVLTLKVAGPDESELAARFQQLTGPVMAKGVEDTVFYRYNRLVSLNEVGGDPGRFGVGVADFHEANRVRLERWPDAMVTTSTHDTKRSEDVRARISLLAEIPEAWRAAVTRWSRILRGHRRDELPERNLEYFLYQTLVGAWPIEAERLTAYLEKAVREAKVFTSWNRPDPGYEAACREFGLAALSDPEFIADFEAFLAPLITAGRDASMAQALLKLTIPGVPDVYQGTELWDLSLVDPDNRRRVDFGSRRRALSRLDRGGYRAAFAHADRGWTKLWLTAVALRLRRERPDVFARGAYEPLETTGSLVAFARGREVVTVAPTRFLSAARSAEPATVALPAGQWRNALTGEEGLRGALPAPRLFDAFPVALLVREDRAP